MLSILTWNINGPGCELYRFSDSEFLSKISKFDIIGLLETWCDNGNYDFPGYFVYNKSRKMSKNARRHSGGILCLIKNSIKNGITIIESKSENLLWIKLHASFFK